MKLTLGINLTFLTFESSLFKRMLRMLSNKSQYIRNIFFYHMLVAYRVPLSCSKIEHIGAYDNN